MHCLAERVVEGRKHRCQVRLVEGMEVERARRHQCRGRCPARRVVVVRAAPVAAATAEVKVAASAAAMARAATAMAVAAAAASAPVTATEGPAAGTAAVWSRVEERARRGWRWRRWRRWYWLG